MEAAVPLSQVKLLAAQAVHDMRNPLAGISNSFYLINNAIPATHPYFEYVGTIEREIRRLAAATRRLTEVLEQADQPAPPPASPEHGG